MVCIKLRGNSSLHHNAVLICNLMYKIGVVLMIDTTTNGLLTEAAKRHRDMFAKAFACGCASQGFKAWGLLCLQLIKKYHKQKSQKNFVGQ